MKTFDLVGARGQFENRINSLEADTNRCFWEIQGGPGKAYFPPVMYALATIDYFSSYWAGWNDSKRDPAKKQTVRLSDFMQRYLKYGKKESLIAVAMWRHKLLHTGEPRVLRSTNGKERYLWQTGINLKSHLKLDPGSTPGEFWLRFDCDVMVRDLHTAVLGRSGYFHDLCASPELQRKFLDCFNEMENYTIDV